MNVLFIIVVLNLSDARACGEAISSFEAETYRLLLAVVAMSPIDLKQRPFKRRPIDMFCFLAPKW